MKVVVRERFRVCHDGKVWLPRETAEVPDALAAEWVAAGWVDQVGGKRSSKAAAAKQGGAGE